MTYNSGRDFQTPWKYIMYLFMYFLLQTLTVTKFEVRISVHC